MQRKTSTNSSSSSSISRQPTQRYNARQEEVDWSGGKGLGANHRIRNQRRGLDTTLAQKWQGIPFPAQMKHLVLEKYCAEAINQFDIAPKCISKTSAVGVVVDVFGVPRSVVTTSKSEYIYVRTRRHFLGEPEFTGQASSSTNSVRRAQDVHVLS